LTVTATEPINLTNVVLAALSEEAFLAADSPDSFLERWLVFDRPVFRQGDVHVLKPGTSGGPAYHYRIEMMEPVQQGCVDFGKTRLVLTLADDENQNIEVSHSLGSSLGPGTESDADGIEIDEGFFASSVLSSQTNRHQGQEVNGIGKIDDSSTFSGVRFNALSLPYQISDQDDNTLYLRTSDLSRVGVLNGDWVQNFLGSAGNFF
jgi:peroxin-6